MGGGDGGEVPCDFTREEGDYIVLKDRVLWNQGWENSVKSLYDALEPRTAVPFWRSIIWSPCVSTKVGFFAWEALWGKTLTLD